MGVLEFEILWSPFSLTKATDADGKKIGPGFPVSVHGRQKTNLNQALWVNGQPVFYFTSTSGASGLSTTWLQPNLRRIMPAVPFF